MGIGVSENPLSLILELGDGNQSLQLIVSKVSLNTVDIQQGLLTLLQVFEKPLVLRLEEILPHIFGIDKLLQSLKIALLDSLRVDG